MKDMRRMVFPVCLLLVLALLTEALAFPCTWQEIHANNASIPFRYDRETKAEHDRIMENAVRRVKCGTRKLAVEATYAMAESMFPWGKLARPFSKLSGPAKRFLGRLFGVGEEVAAKTGGDRLALGISEHLDDFAKAQGATTWKSFPDPLNWKPTMMEKLADPNTKILFNLQNVEVWPGVTRAARGAGGATDWELLQIQQNPQFWNSIEWFNGAKPAANPFQ